MNGSPQTLLEVAEERLAIRDLSGALSAFDHAQLAGALPGRCFGGRWTAHMLAGDFAAAWRESDAIRLGDLHDPHRFWNGEDLDGRRVILRCLHGYGDAVQFLRYAPMVSRRAASMVVEVPPAMVEVASCFDGICDVITWGDETKPARDWDVQIEVMELPYLFRSEIQDLPLAQCYLRVPAEVRRRAADAMGFSSMPRIGIVWAAGDWDTSRSLPFDLLRPLLRCSSCQFWSLQGGTARQQWCGSAEDAHLRDSAACGEGILPLAGVISRLDLVITVDTLAAHLAGAMGKPAWLLLQHAADWRWMTGRNDTPWYPSLRLFRQPLPGDWSGTVQKVVEELRHWLTTPRECEGV